MRKIAALCAITSLILAGCSGTATDKPAGDGGTTPSTSGTSEGRLTASAELAGDWKGKVKAAPAQKDDIAGKMGEAMADLFEFNLEIKPDDTYTMTVFVLPISGKLTRNGDEITLTPEKVMGMTPEEYKKSQPPNQLGKEPDMSPMKGKISADGKTITVSDKTNNSDIEFTRIPAKVVGPATVSAEEAKYVGAYKGVVDKSKLKPEEAGTASMEQFLKLKLEQDKTFVMSVGMKVEGTWKLEGDKITLSASDKSFKGPGGKDPQMKVDGTKLMPIDATMPFHFVKE